MGINGLAVVHRVGRFDGGSFDSLVGRGGSVARKISIAELGRPCSSARGPPPAANLISVRNAAPLYGLGLIDKISDAVIEAGTVAQSTVKGRTNIVRDAQGRPRVGRFGWKADVATLTQFVAEAFRNELGITSPLAPTDLIPRDSDCKGTSAELDDDGTSIAAVTAFLAALPAPPATVGTVHQDGANLFSVIGCAACHTPVLSVDGAEARLYSDLLLHDMGSPLDDSVIQGSARGKDWRTTPLWGLGSRARFLHDGRAESITDAISAHDGEAALTVKKFRQLTQAEKRKILNFLSAL